MFRAEVLSIMKKNRTDPVSCKIIFITGVDGSGKTYVARHLIKALNAKGIPAVHAWSRFNNYLSKPLLAFAKVIGLNYYEVNNGVKVGYHDFEKSKIISFLFIRLQLIDVWIASIIKFWIPILFGQKIIIADRGPYDTIIDVSLDTGRYNLPDSLTGKLYCIAVPFSHKVFLIKRQINKIENDRPDIKQDRKLKKRMNLYLRHEKQLNFIGISNNESVEQTVSDILRKILHEKKEKTTQVDY